MRRQKQKLKSRLTPPNKNRDQEAAEPLRYRRRLKFFPGICDVVDSGCQPCLAGVVRNFSYKYLLIWLSRLPPIFAHPLATSVVPGPSATSPLRYASCYAQAQGGLSWPPIRRVRRIHGGGLQQLPTNSLPQPAAARSRSLHCLLLDPLPASCVCIPSWLDENCLQAESC
jgi:hypothetical protein